MRKNAFSLILVAAVVHCLLSDASANRLLIDDFSIDQQGFVAGDPVVFDLLEDPRLFGGGREIWGDSDDIAETFGADVENGTLNANVSSNDSGSLNSTWPALFSDSQFDLSKYSYLMLDIRELSDSATLQFTVSSKNSGLSSVFDSLARSGIHVYKLPSSADLSSVEFLSAGFALEANAHIAVNAVWLLAPEPTSLMLSTVVILGLVSCRRFIS